MSERYTSIRTIIDQVLEHPLLSDLSLEAIIRHTVNFMRITGVPRMFIDKVTLVEISNYRGVLPRDWYETTQIRECNSQAAIRESSDTFYSQDIPTGTSVDYTFKIQGNLIYTNLETGVFEMSYQAFQLDDDGIPMIPENSNFYRALMAYIKKQHFTILFDLGKITQASLQMALQDYAFAVGACETDFQSLNLSKAETLFNSFRTLIPRDSEFQRGFVNNGTKERIKLH